MNFAGRSMTEMWECCDRGVVILNLKIILVVIKMILLAGRPGSGKDTVGNYLVQNYGYERIAFADILKEEVSETYGIPLHYFHDREIKDSFIPYTVKTYRQLLIEYADERRAEDPNYFVKRAVPKIKRDKTVITDCRFYNEADFFSKAILVWIDRKVEAIDDNAEIEMKDCDGVVDNNEPFHGKKIVDKLNYFFNQKWKTLSTSDLRARKEIFKKSFMKCIPKDLPSA